MALRLVNNAKAKQRSYYAMIKIFIFIFGRNGKCLLGLLRIPQENGTHTKTNSG